MDAGIVQVTRAFSICVLGVIASPRIFTPFANNSSRSALVHEGPCTVTVTLIVSPRCVARSPTLKLVIQRHLGEQTHAD
jgi:hypothetical protein